MDCYGMSPRVMECVDLMIHFHFKISTPSKSISFPFTHHETDWFDIVEPTNEL
jgi:hypothetical protein